jgi:putative ABC transport system permease protein
MLLDMLMLSAGLGVSFSRLLSGAGYAVRVAPAGTLPFDTDATVPGAAALRRSIESDPGVAGAAPVLGANLLEGRSSARRVFVLGIDPTEQGLFRLTGGRLPASGNEAVAGAGLAAEGVTPGDTLWLSSGGGLGSVAGGAPRPFVVSGTGEFFYASSSERTLALPIGTVAEITARPDRASLFMVRLRPGAHAASVAARLVGAHPAVEATSIGELVERAERRLSYFRQLALILGTVSLLVTTLLVGTIMAVSINDRYGTIAALRAIGVSRRSVLAALATESLLLCTGAAVLGLGLGLVTAGRLERILADFPGLPSAIRFFVLQPGHVALAIVLLLVAGAGSALVPAWRVTQLPIATTLHQEEP